MTTETRFLSDIKDHVMEVIRNDGVHRHIRFSRPGTMCMHFDLITWPGVLCYTGDMGTYVFQRLNDMFEFFRTERLDNDRLYINAGYWSEKLIAVDGGCNGGNAMEFSEEKFRRVVNEYRIQWIRSAKERGLLSKEQRRELWEEVETAVFYRIDDGEHAAMQAAYDFHHHIAGSEWMFEDFWDHSFKTYTYHFMWCLYALAWGIKTYDAAQAEAVTA